MGYDKINLGDTRIGTGPYLIGGVTNNAVIVLRAHKRREVAVMNLDVTPAPQTYSPVEQMLQDYLGCLNQTSGEDEEATPDSIEALVFGGDFVQHRAATEGQVISRQHKMMKDTALEVLDVLQIGSVQYKQTDVRATKTLTVESGGYVTVEQTRRGLNKKDAVMTEEEYAERKSRQCETD